MQSLRSAVTAPFLALATLLLGAATPGQNAPAPAAAPAPLAAVDESPWLYRGSDIPHDTGWRFGTLPNGLRLAVRHNGVPPGQVSIRVRMDVGSLMEDESQRGFAHLMEHLSFRGSKYVADGEAKRTWQRFGATFGTDTNASTTFTQTVFRLDLPAASAASVDESLHILSGMMSGPIIDAPTLNSERPVVLAEMREQPSAQVRLSDLWRETLFAGQPLADRSPIGTIKTLEAATPESVRAFHDRWYRPERALVVVAGDLDAKLLESLVAKNFGDWRGGGPAPKDPDLGKPVPGKPATAAVTEPTLPTGLSYAVLRPWTVGNDTIIFNQKRMIDFLALAIINRRLESRARAGGSFLQASVDLDDVARSANVTSVTITPIGDGWAEALKDVRAVIADAMAKPPTQAEIDREVAEMEVPIRTAAQQESVAAGTKLADDMVQAVDIHETTTTSTVELGIYESARKAGMFNPGAVFDSTHRVFQGIERAVVNIHGVDPQAPAKLEAALKADVAKAAGHRRAQAAVSFAKLPKLGAPGTVVSRAPIGGVPGLEAVTYSNGTRLLLFPQPGDAGRVFVRVRFGRGYAQLPPDKPSLGWTASLALAQAGIGRLGADDLDAMTVGRVIGMDFGIDDDAFTISGQTTSADYGDELKLYATKLGMPGWDPHPVERAKAVMLASYASMNASPDGVLQRDLEGLLHDGDKRWTTPARDEVSALTPAAFKAFWAPILASGPIEVEVFGDIKPDEVVKTVGATIGALPRRADAARPGLTVRFPAHDAQPVMRSHDGSADQAVAVIAWPTGSGLDGAAEGRRLDILAQIFTDRLFERLRNAAGASYSPQVASQWPYGLNGGGRIVAMGKVPPDKVSFFFTLAREIAADLAAHPVSADELARLEGPMSQSVLRAATASPFWMNLLEGATEDPRRVAVGRAIKRDYDETTPATLQATAQKYLRPEADWTMAVVPAKGR